MSPVQKNENEQDIIDESRVLLKEKRISLSVMRAGIAIFVVQILILGFMIATSKSYRFLEVMHMTIPFYITNAGLMLFGYYLIITTLLREKAGMPRAVQGMNGQNRGLGV